MSRNSAILLGAGFAALLLKKKKRKSESSERSASQVLQIREDASRAQMLVFTAKWCGVCDAVMPKIHEIDEKQPNINFEYIDVDTNPAAAKLFNIKGVPTFVATRDGKEVDRLQGFRSDDAMRTLMKAALGHDEEIKVLPARVSLPIIDLGPDYMTGEIPKSAGYGPSKIYSWQPLETRGMKIIVGPKSCQYCVNVVESKDGRGAYCTLWKAKVIHNYVCNSFEARADL